MELTWSKRDLFKCLIGIKATEAPPKVKPNIAAHTKSQEQRHLTYSIVRSEKRNLLSSKDLLEDLVLQLKNRRSFY